MSHEGKMYRGAKWNRHRDSAGELVKGVREDPVKMADVEYYLEHKEKEEKPKEETKKTKSKGKK